LPLLNRLDLQGDWQMVSGFGIKNDLGNTEIWGKEHTLSIGNEYILGQYWCILIRQKQI